MVFARTDVSAQDADELAHHWGTVVAVAMLQEGVISRGDFVWLCAEAADAPNP
jgi:hypothetical protein